MNMELAAAADFILLQNKLGDTPLHAAAWKGYSDIVEMLLNKSKFNVVCLVL